MSKIQLVLNGHVDRKVIIDALAADSSYVVEVVNNYLSSGADVYNLELNDLDGTAQESFYQTLDSATKLIEDAALVWKIFKDTKTFNLESSYVRDRDSTETPLTTIDDGTPLKLRIEVPGFLVNGFREIDLWYNSDFNPADLDLMEEIGVTITGNGAEFTIANTVECKVSFGVPAGVGEVYVIDYNLSAEIIEV